jgi:hypothetical protein
VELSIGDDPRARRLALRPRQYWITPQQAEF